MKDRGFKKMMVALVSAGAFVLFAMFLVAAAPVSSSGATFETATAGGVDLSELREPTLGEVMAAYNDARLDKAVVLKFERWYDYISHEGLGYIGAKYGLFIWGVWFFLFRLFPKSKFVAAMREVFEKWKWIKPDDPKAAKPEKQGAK